MQHRFFFRRSLWLTPGLLLAAGVLLGLVACAPGGRSAGQSTAGGNEPQTTASATATPTPGHEDADQGTLNGDVVAGPTCPVATAEQPCPPRPVPDRQVMIVTPGGKVAATTTTDKNGHFRVLLSPGRYLVKVAPVPGGYPAQREPVEVTIAAGQTLSVKIELDTGIR